MKPEDRRHKVAELMERHQISRTTLGKLANIRQSNISSYINGTFPMGDEVYSRIMKGLDEFIRSGKVDEKYRKKSEPKVTLTKAEKQVLFQQRRDWLDELMEQERLSSQLLAQYAGIGASSIDQYRTGKLAMREYVVEKIKVGVQRIIDENVPRSEIKVKPKKIHPYILRNLKDYGNVYVHREMMRRGVVKHCNENGIEVSTKLMPDGNYILTDMNRFKTLYKGECHASNT